MYLIVLSVVLSVLAALVDHFFGINEPWRKMIYAGIVIVFILGVVFLLLRLGGIATPAW